MIEILSFLFLLQTQYYLKWDANPISDNIVNYEVCINTICKDVGATPNQDKFGANTFAWPISLTEILSSSLYVKACNTVCSESIPIRLTPPSQPKGLEIKKG